ncbi:TraB/GumN family protein [Dongia sp.]|uniref:TraB/GumN family protein n=1 Tax=Dongia sp. TaxID=1977262 RepID=UPI0035AFAE80
MPAFMTRLGNLARRGLLALLALLPMAGTAVADPALWVARQGQATFYLFGTFHMLKPGIDWRSEKIDAAFASSDALWLEMAEGTDVNEALLWKYGKDPAHPLSTKLSAAERTRLRAAAERAGIQPVMLESLRPWLAASTLASAPMMNAGYESAFGADNRLLAAAKAAHKPVNGFETAEQQLRFMADLPPEMELAMLAQVISYQAQTETFQNQIFDAWLAGDAEKLGTMMTADMLSPADKVFYQRLLVDRNAAWTERIAVLAKAGGTHFIAVGAGHLAGEESLQAKLRQRGFTVERF